MSEPPKAWNYRLVRLDDCVGLCEVHYEDGIEVGRTRTLLLFDDSSDQSYQNFLQRLRAAFDAPLLEPIKKL